MAILALAMVLAFSVISLHLLEAHTPPWNVPTIAYISVSPNPIGVEKMCPKLR